MKLKPPKRRAMPETIVALIDVVFFLLIFFMLIGRMDASSPFEVEPSISITGADMPGGGTTLSVSENGKFALDGMPIDKIAIEKEVKKALKKDGDLLLRINAHKNAELRHVLPIIAKLEKLGLKDIIIVVTPEKL
jgi:biopolymer transport protein ExbD|tara:strand:- start:44 stop:448 length:405 start_codon:yes stop_codon:yes gene_type:complete